MTEKIVEIKENENGYDIVTDKQKISIFVDCPAGGGFITSEDNIQDFIGADLLDIKETDELLEKASLKLDKGDRFYIQNYKDMYAVFIDIETSKGILQFVLYDEGCEYYGTSYKITSEQLNMEGSLTLP